MTDIAALRGEAGAVTGAEEGGGRKAGGRRGAEEGGRAGAEVAVAAAAESEPSPDVKAQWSLSMLNVSSPSDSVCASCYSTTCKTPRWSPMLR